MNMSKSSQTPNILLALVLGQLVVIGLLLMQVMGSTEETSVQAIGTEETSAQAVETEESAPPNVVTVEVTREVLVVVTPTFTPLPPTPTSIPVELTYDNDPFMGNANAPVTVVEFSDFQCSYCGRFYATTLRPLTEYYGDLIKFVYRDYPIFGDPSVQAGLAAECADDQGKFWEYHNAIFEKTSMEGEQISYDALLAWATELELETEAWESCMAGTEALDEVSMDFRDGREWGITGTPTFFINGRKLVGAHPLETFIQVIDAELLALGIEPPQSGR